FTSASYWDLVGRFAKDGDAATFDATLVAVDGTRIASGRDFDASGNVTDGVLALDEEAARALAGALEGSDFSVRSVDTKPYTRRPYAPFRTSTLQMDAGRKLRFSSSRTMAVAQRLYETGYITYMRTDSVTLSTEAITEARNQIQRLFGADYVPDSPRAYGNRATNAQEAHEAIRPAGETWR